MATLDSSIVNIALPTITADLVTDLSLTKWIVISYLLAISCLLLPFGRLSDLYGRRLVFGMGLVVFTLGSVCCATSASIGALILSRVFQGIGASMLMSNGPAILTAAFPPSELGKALGTMAMVVSIGLICGPSIGGFLISQTTLGWRLIFLINIPFGIIGTVLVLRYVPAPKSKKSSQASFDWIGAFLQSVVIILLMALFDPPMVSISQGSAFPISRALTAALVVIFTVIFLRVQLFVKNPILDLELLKDQTFWTGNLAGFFSFVAYSAIIVLMPFYLEQILSFSPRKAGLFMTAIPLTIFVIAPISGRLSDRIGSQELSAGGAFVAALALFLMSGGLGTGIDQATKPKMLLIALSAVGLAMGLFQSPNNNAIMRSVPPEKLGSASALLATVRNVGLVTGTGLATSIFALRLEKSGNFVSAMHWAYTAAGFIAVGATLASFGKKRGPVKEVKK